MGVTSIDSVATSDMTNRIDAIEIEPKSLQGVGDQEETEYINSDFSKYLGIFKTIPEVKMAITMRATWTIGNGFEADPYTTVLLNSLRGWGTDTFNLILKNMMIIKRINGDAYAEIVRDPDTDEIINIKPLDPGSIKIIVDRKGVIKRYEQTNKLKKSEVLHKFKPEEIFHLSNNRLGDEIHGISDIEALLDIIQANKDSFVISGDIIKKYAKPRLMVGLDTDDPLKIDEFVYKFDTATNKGENLFFPKGSVETPQVLAIPANSTLSVLPWREHLKSYFYQVVGIPQIILGSASDYTESAAKIAYLAFEQLVDDEQNDIEQQIWNQLNLRIQLSFPATLRNEMLSDEDKDGNGKDMGFQPGDTTAGVGK